MASKHVTQTKKVNAAYGRLLTYSTSWKGVHRTNQEQYRNGRRGRKDTALLRQAGLL